MEYTVDGELVYFNCERCGERSVTIRRSQCSDRTFCDNCGTCYSLLLIDAAGSFRLVSTEMEEMYLPPTQWIRLHNSGAAVGERWETGRRRARSFRQRLGDFIHNR